MRKALQRTICVEVRSWLMLVKHPHIGHRSTPNIGERVMWRREWNLVMQSSSRYSGRLTIGVSMANHSTEIQKIK